MQLLSQTFIYYAFHLMHFNINKVYETITETKLLLFFGRGKKRKRKELLLTLYKGADKIIIENIIEISYY